MLETEEASLEIFAPVPVSTSTLETVGGRGGLVRPDFSRRG